MNTDPETRARRAAKRASPQELAAAFDAGNRDAVRMVLAGLPSLSASALAMRILGVLWDAYDNESAFAFERAVIQWGRT